MKKRKGFTLVELLAVIVILAIILIIAVPQIMDTIEQSRKGSFESSAKLVADSAEKQYAADQVLGKNLTGWETGVDCLNASWAGLDEEDYSYCNVKIVDDTAQVTLKGNGKFENYIVKSATKTDVSVIVLNGIALQISKMNTENNTEGLAITTDENIRYVGANPNNYVWFNCDDGYTEGSTHCEKWRIIGVFDNGVKIIRDEALNGTYSWDSSDSTINNGWGINGWSESDIIHLLNGYYYDEDTRYSSYSTCLYCNDYGQSTCSNVCTFSKLKTNAKNMIANTTWYIGTPNTINGSTTTNKIKALDAYNNERNSDNTGRKCSSGNSCNDGIDRTTTWTGSVGLMSVSDYGYASSACADTRVLLGYNYSTCTSTNWLHNSSNQWTISPCATSIHASYVWSVASYGIAGSGRASDAKGVRPVVFLKDTVQITGNDGSIDSPYTLG